jgi:hypothetical protein
MQEEHGSGETVLGKDTSLDGINLRRDEGPIARSQPDEPQGQRRGGSGEPEDGEECRPGLA